MKTTRVVTTLFAMAISAMTLNSIAAEPSADQKRIMGIWQGAAVDGDGSKPGSARARIGEMVITEDKITAKDPHGNNMGEGTYKISRSGNLITIDTTATKGQLMGKSYQGIMTVDGDNMKWCSNNPGKPRPTAFRTTPPDAYLMILTRKK
ncbi:MAG TPA: TIGR03067 domain-containing protein [Verrucomicrobiae bacterium]